MAKGPAEVAHGSIFIGFVIKLILYGLIILQGYLYFATFKRDRGWMKFLIAFLLVADTVNIVFDTIYLYTALIKHFDDPGYLANANWLFATGDNHCSSATVLCMASQSIDGQYLDGFFDSSYIHFQQSHPFIAGSQSVLSEPLLRQSGCDHMACWFRCVRSLHNHSNDMASRQHKNTFGGSNQVIDRIIRSWAFNSIFCLWFLIKISVTVQTGLLQTVLAIIDLIFFLVDPSGTHLIFNWILSKLYSNTILSSLNSRSGWKFGSSDDGQRSTVLPSRPGHPPVVQVFRQEEVELSVIPGRKEDLYPSSERSSDHM
ncbi:hypothetical protein PLEOSDRAFT_171365 [Pleurotus ostreatus PC15]|uniref:DUF6534 domain-containing protein n=1 Tax=Pleurotus ostreatus (strain PC15) TaxID=1137138 RepID=A0A067NGN3_PLEO1|nr:hypothetical protein PLEOSDRAFT_171365 [Pleurotus ostreatus PC15]